MTADGIKHYAVLGKEWAERWNLCRKCMRDPRECSCSSSPAGLTGALKRKARAAASTDRRSRYARNTAAGPSAN